VISHVDGLFGPTSFAKGVELARGLLNTPQPVRMIYLLASGIDIANDQLIAGLIMKIGAGLFIWAIIAVIFFRWAASEELRNRPDRALREMDRELIDMGLRK